MSYCPSLNRACFTLPIVNAYASTDAVLSYLGPYRLLNAEYGWRIAHGWTPLVPSDCSPYWDIRVLVDLILNCQCVVLGDCEVDEWMKSGHRGLQHHVTGISNVMHGIMYNCLPHACLGSALCFINPGCADSTYTDESNHAVASLGDKYLRVLE